MAAKYDPAVERWKSVKQRHPDFLERIAAPEASLRMVLAELELSPDWEEDLLTRAPVRAALAKRERALRAEMLAGNKQADTLLRADFDMRPASGKSVKEAFGDTIRAFHQWTVDHPDARAADCYRELHRLVTRGASKTTAERRAEHAEQRPSEE